MTVDSTSAELLYRVAQQLNSSLDLDEVLGKVLRLTVEATGAIRGSFFLLDEKGNVIRQILARPNQTSEISQLTVQKVMSEGLAGWVYENRQPALVFDTTKDERWLRLPNDKDIMGAALVVPLMVHGRINGLLALHHHEVNYFNEKHLSLTEGIAGQAATAIENARLYTQAKREHEALYAFMSGITMPVLVVNNGAIVFRNRVAEQLLQVKDVNIPLMSIIGGEVLNEALEHLQKAGDSRTEVQWPDERIFDISVNSVSQHGTVITLNDISHLKKLDEMKSLFVETVSHDLKSPLSAIKGYTMLLSMSENLSDRDKTNLANIQQSTEQMQALITNLLDLAEIEAGLSGEIEVCNVAEIAQDVLESFQLQIEEKKIKLTVNLSPELALVSADPMRLSQVVANYISNAVKYTPQGGQVTVKGHNTGLEVHLEVSDTGPGIPPSAQSQLFQKFYRVPEINGSIEGTGLGLSIVKAIVEGYGGRVFVKSELGAGSTFGCALPMTDEVAL